jgi:adenylate cyclase
MKAWISHTISSIQQIGADPQDSEDLRLHKSLFAIGVFLIVVATLIWGSIFSIYHQSIPAGVSYTYSVFSLITLLVVRRTRKIRFFLYGHIFLGLLLPFLEHFFLGGFSGSSGVVLWSIMSPLAALFFFSFQKALPWWTAYLILLVFAGLIQPFTRQDNPLPPAVVTGFFVLNMCAVSSIVIVILNYFNQQKIEAYRLLRIEQEKAENLLLDMLPKEIAAILKNEKRTIADQFDGASILFADLVGFTTLTASLAPVEMVNLLNQIFTFFDSLVEKYQLEKIRTIGDNYMVAAGVPRPRTDHAQVLASMALEMQAYISALPLIDGKAIQFRIGINSGAVIGGVIGRKKFVYDLWGDAVNIASRMESQGIAGKIQITQSTYELIGESFACEWRGPVSIKGRGEMPTWFLVGFKPELARPAEAFA